jgi:hypothetical protein
MRPSLVHGLRALGALRSFLQLSTVARWQLPENYRILNYRFVRGSDRGPVRGSDRDRCGEVIVENSTHPQAYEPDRGICTSRPATGGGLLRSVMPRPSISIRAAT